MEESAGEGGLACLEAQTRRCDELSAHHSILCHSYETTHAGLRAARSRSRRSKSWLKNLGIQAFLDSGNLGSSSGL